MAGNQMLGTKVIENNEEIPRLLATSREERVIIGGAHRLQKEADVEWWWQRRSKSSFDKQRAHGTSLLREDHDGVSNIIKENQISVKDKSTSSESVWASGNID